MWGTDQRDSATIASRVAQRLAALAQPGTTYEVSNFGETGYVSTQELIELQLQLRRGNIPDVVVFYDGINDVAAAAQADEAGIPQNEINRARDFEVGRAIHDDESGFGRELAALATIGSAMAQRSHLIRRLMAVMPARGGRTTRTDEQLAIDIATVYTGNVSIVEALGQTYGFQALYVWQPTLHTTTKSLTSHEQRLIDGLSSRPFHQRLGALHRAIVPVIDSAMSRRVGARFVNASSLFAKDTMLVYTDDIGHNTEKSIHRIVDAFFHRLIALARAPERTMSAIQ